MSEATREKAETRTPQMRAEPKPRFPEQHQTAPGIEAELQPRPRYEARRYRAAGKLEGKAALVTGGDSGIGRAAQSSTHGRGPMSRFLISPRSSATRRKPSAPCWPKAGAACCCRAT